MKPLKNHPKIDERLYNELSKCIKEQYRIYYQAHQDAHLCIRKMEMEVLTLQKLESESD